MAPVRRSLPIALLSALWLLAAWPIALWLLAHNSPLAAVRLAQGAQATAASVAFSGAVFVLVFLFAWPPFPAAIRLGVARMRAVLTADRATLMRNLAELRHIETPARHLEIGRLALQIGEDRLAAVHLQRAHDLEPGHLGTLYAIAQLQLRLRQPEAARAVLMQVVEQDPAHAFGEAMLLLGRTTFTLGDRAQGLAWLQRHEREHGGNRKSHCWLAEALLAAGDTAGARAAWQTAAAPSKQRLTAEENWYRAKAKVTLWRLRGRA